MSLKRHILLEYPVKIIRGCISGKRTAQTSLYESFAPKMFVVCLRYSKNREEAEEVLQEGFLKVFDNIHKFEFKGSFEGWIRTIMVNTALQNYRRKRNLQAIVNIENIGADLLYAEDISLNLTTKELLETIQQLPATYRMVFNLYVFEGLTHREISAQLGISEGTSKSNLFDARKILRKKLDACEKLEMQNVQSL